jgi:alpha-1,6-mannosyltransferase
MHIADVTMFYAARSGGIRRYLDVKHAWLPRRACRHTLVVPAGNGCEADVATLSLRSVPLPLSGGYRVPVGVRGAVRALTALHPQVIECADPYHLAWSVLRARDAAPCRAVAFCHSDLPQLVAGACGARAERLATRYLRRLYGEFDLVLAPSAFLARKLVALGVSRVEHQPLGVDVETFHPRRRSSELRRRLECGAPRRLLVYAGRYAREKNLEVLAAMARLLGDRYRLVLAGAGRLPSSLPENAIVLPYVGGRAELATLLASCDAFVHAGDQETFGLSVLEAMACAVPVVGASAAGVGEIVAQGGGITVVPRDARALADGVACLFERDLDATRAAARRNAERHAWEAVLETLLARYRMLAS